jgi:hypothetical protein
VQVYINLIVFPVWEISGEGVSSGERSLSVDRSNVLIVYLFVHRVNKSSKKMQMKENASRMYLFYLASQRL